MVDRQELIVVDPSTDPEGSKEYFKHGFPSAKLILPRLEDCLGVILSMPTKESVAGDIPVPEITVLKQNRLPYLEEVIDYIPHRQRKSTYVLLTGTSYPMNGVHEVNEFFAGYQRLAHSVADRMLLRSGFREEMIRRVFSPPNIFAYVTFDTLTNQVDIKRYNRRTGYPSYTSLILSAGGVYRQIIQISQMDLNNINVH